MELKFLKRGRKSIIFSRTINPGSENPSAPEEEERRICHEAPLPELDSALAALRPMVCEINNHQKKFFADMVVRKIGVTYTKEGTRTVQLWYEMSLDTIGGQPHPLFTPKFKIDPPQGDESGEVYIKPEQAELVKAAIRECERYADGERSQTLLDFDEAKAALNATAAVGAGDMFANA